MSPSTGERRDHRGSGSTRSDGAAQLNAVADALADLMGELGDEHPRLCRHRAELTVAVDLEHHVSASDSRRAAAEGPEYVLAFTSLGTVALRIGVAWSWPRRTPQTNGFRKCVGWDHSHMCGVSATDIVLPREVLAPRSGRIE